MIAVVTCRGKRPHAPHISPLAIEHIPSIAVGAGKVHPMCCLTGHNKIFCNTFQNLHWSLSHTIWIMPMSSWVK